MRNSFIILVFLLVLIPLTCSAKISGAILKADPNCKVILVVVMKDTDTVFKNALIDSLKIYFQPKFQVKKLLLKKVSDLYNQPYRVMIVMDQLKAWLAMNGKTKAIQKDSDLNHVVYFMTTGDPKWQWKTKDVHHIASASEKPKLSQTWSELRTKVDTLVK
jgi:hypothetical protein